MADFVRVGSLAEVPEGEIRAYDVAGIRIGIAHLATAIAAFRDECPEDGCSLSEGALDDEEGAVVCPCDGSAFDLSSGEPVSGPAVDPIALYRARVEAGWLEVAVE
ncbi:MAG: Rieske 2Fe-2S domain-containing protein [Actinobacteria bacterium]|nr:Rieske 2Fe-2S domain-containing protein [Actinomycetota bacterium]